jgi:hypothetical protein
VFTERGLGRPAVTSGRRQASQAVVGGLVVASVWVRGVRETLMAQ